MWLWVLLVIAVLLLFPGFSGFVAFCSMSGDLLVGWFCGDCVWFIVALLVVCFDCCL